MPKSDWFTKLVLLQADLIYNSLSFLFSPIFFLMSVVSESYHRAEETTVTVESAVKKVPSTVTHGSIVLLKKLGFGVFGAAYVCMVLLVVLVVAVVLGVALVQMWVEEPVLLKEKLHFDYTEAHPKALFVFERSHKRKQIGVPVGHTFSVSVVLLMPESDFNRDIGVFQLSAELLSTNGLVIGKSSLPCMLRFRSLPVRLARTFLMSIPLLLGITGETQKITFEVLRHKEGYPRTEAIRVTLSPRAGTTHLPQLYEAEIVMKSKLPWTKELVRSWKWTFYVWSTLYTYIVLLIALFNWCNPIFFPLSILSLSERGEREEETTLATDETHKEQPQIGVDDVHEEPEDVSEMLRKWRLRRSKRKAIYTEAEVVGSSASTFTITREETSAAAVEEHVGDSEESVCL
ncbi:seipin-1 [Morus notabilis]|nr:seipin-1 [Morus notabilis]